MEVQLLMSLVSGAAVVVGALVSLSMIGHKTRAEREYLRLLNAQATTLRGLRDRMMHAGVVSSEELQQLIASLDRATEGLSSEHRRLIAEGLHQPSLRGRARYAAKLMNKAGIGSGSFPLATP